MVEGDAVTEDAKKNYDLIKDKVEILDWHEAPASGGYDIIVDAIYGTGFHGELREAGRASVNIINKFEYQKSIVFAIDIPSGLPGDYTGIDDPEISVMADYTITFHAKKPVHANGRMSNFLGNVLVADIGISEALAKGEH